MLKFNSQMIDGTAVWDAVSSAYCAINCALSIVLSRKCCAINFTLWILGHWFATFFNHKLIIEIIDSFHHPSAHPSNLMARNIHHSAQHFVNFMIRDASRFTFIEKISFPGGWRGHPGLGRGQGGDLRDEQALEQQAPPRGRGGRLPRHSRRPRPRIPRPLPHPLAARLPEGRRHLPQEGGRLRHL